MTESKQPEQKKTETSICDLTFDENPKPAAPKAKPWDGVDRREIPKAKDTLYRFALIGNTLAWLAFVASMVIFHFARPEQETGVNRFWGVEVRTEWHADYLPSLLILLASCTVLSFVALVLRKQRSRRKNDSFALNVFLLLLLAAGGLVWMYNVFVQTSAS